MVVQSAKLLKFLRVIGDETRQRLIALLAESVRPSGELAELLGISPATCSHHLSRLAELGLVTVEKEGNFRLYSLRRDALDEFKQGALALLPSSAPGAGIPDVAKSASGKHGGAGQPVSGWVALNGDLRLEVSLSLTEDRQLQAITLGRLVKGRAIASSDSPAEVAAVGACLAPGASLEVDPWWDKIKLTIAGNMVWGMKLADKISPFQQMVFRRLLQVSAGSTITYGELSRDVGSSPRAVGGAVARNPWPLLVPCHRVVRSDGELGGYSARGGVALKKRLLAFEALAASYALREPGVWRTKRTKSRVRR